MAQTNEWPIPLLDAHVADVLFLIAVIRRAILAHEVVAHAALNLLVEDEEEAREAAHAAVFIELLLFGKNQYLGVFLFHVLINFPEETKNEMFRFRKFDKFIHLCIQPANFTCHKVITADQQITAT